MRWCDVNATKFSKRSKDLNWRTLFRSQILKRTYGYLKLRVLILKCGVQNVLMQSRKLSLHFLEKIMSVLNV